MKSYKINDLLEKQNNIVSVQDCLKIVDSPQVISAIIMNEAHTKYEVRTKDGYTFRFSVDAYK